MHSHDCLHVCRAARERGDLPPLPHFRSRGCAITGNAVQACLPITLLCAAGLPASAETCLHYLTFAAEDVPQYKCIPGGAYDLPSLCCDVRAVRAAGLPVSAETCPHYLTFAAEDVPGGATQYKCAPPIRAAANREALWQGLQEGVLDGVASDHSPAPPALKLLETGDFLAAWGGVAGELLEVDSAR